MSRGAERRHRRRPPRRPRRRRPRRPKPLFDRLGGKPAVEAVVDEFLKRVAADKRINGRFFNTDIAASARPAGRVRLLRDRRPCQYTGRDMRSSHAGFQLVEEEFNALGRGPRRRARQVQRPQEGEGRAAGRARAAGEGDRQPAAGRSDGPRRRAGEARRREKVAELRQAGKADAADLLEIAIAARVRGQRSYAEQLYSAAERLAPPGASTKLDPLFRAGAPERITTALKTLPKDTRAQPKDAVGGSDEEAREAEERIARRDDEGRRRRRARCWA